MAPYDSDSSEDEDGAYTETNVLLGYAEPEDQHQDDGDGTGTGVIETISRLGGEPDWLAGKNESPVAASASLARCLVCKALMVLLLQLNGELPDRFPGHERRLYLLACRNKICRRKAGSVRVIRGIVANETGPESPQKPEPEAQPKAKALKPSGNAPGLGEALFGVSNPFSGGSGSANPFSIGSPSASTVPTANPFSLGGIPAAQPMPAPQPAAPEEPATDAAEDLPKTFAETLSLNTGDKGPGTGAPGPPSSEPWPAADTWPTAYPVSWIAEADYETLDPTSSPVPQQTTMDLDDGALGRGGDGKEDKYVFESSMDGVFQKFADRVAQNPDQVIRYEFGGQPLLYNKDDAVAKVWDQTTSAQSQASLNTMLSSTTACLPPCPSCRSRRVFEVQLMPHAIDLLEANELGLEGMDWGTIVVAVCEKDCQTRWTRPGEASYLEEWAGVQWEELQARR